MAHHLAILGGDPVRTEPYPDWPEIDERDAEAVADVVRHGQIGGWPEPGPKAAEFCSRFAAYQGAEHGIVMVNGTVTMEVALKALGIGWGDEVIVPALTFAATAYAAIAAGALPVIVDVEPERWTIDPDAVEAAITPATRAIMPVHLGQQMADMDRLAEIADRHGLAIVEDCAHAHGQQWGGRGAGCIGAFGSFSHQSSKILTSGEGGSLLTDDDALARRAHSIIDCGRPKDASGQEYTFGANYRLGELNCALLCTQLDRFEQQRAERERGARLFEQLAGGLEGVSINPIHPRVTRWSFYRYLVRIDPEAFGGATCETVADALEAEGIAAEVQYPPMSRYELFQPHLSRLPVCVEHADRLDPARMSFPVAEAAGERQAVYLNECVFRAGRQGVEDVVAALAKVQEHAHELAASGLASA
ncbi:MAG TPA: DegT/DnrJ/EryC1/StrS family aminotransferase [Gaiellales bacterium]|nr:DegT/DnrJ/EryC1/StrS family aminotransferase [Gaiellales bacterium]